jgi:hypothetical protein
MEARSRPVENGIRGGELMAKMICRPIIAELAYFLEPIWSRITM